MPDTSPEAAVRDYLTYLNDPDSLVDTVGVERLQEALAETVDPIERLMTMAAINRASTHDPHAYEQAFIAHAKAWAKAEDVPAAAFEQMGVPSDVLVSAGLIPGKGRRGARRPSPTLS